MLNKLKPPPGATHKVKTVGRGPGCHGKTSGRGHKGQRARSGGRVAAWFEGGQTPLKMRSPKRGFTHSAKVVYDLINVEDLNRFGAGETITPEQLKEAGLISGKHRVKVLGDGELTLSVNVKAHGFSKQAIKKIEERGGKTEVL